MKEENKKNKKKLLLTYLILAACLLVIAAVTLTVVLTVNRKSRDLSIDNTDQTQTDDGTTNKPDDGKDPDDDVPTNTDTGYRLPVESAVVSTRYEFAHNSTVGQFRVHQGIDFEGSAGDSVCAVLDGTVKEVVTDSHIGENYVVITHADGVSSTYKYIDVKNGLKVGDTVKRGEIIGSIAAAGGYEVGMGEHLHFEMSVNGRTADPEIYLDLVEK